MITSHAHPKVRRYIITSVLMPISGTIPILSSVSTYDIGKETQGKCLLRASIRTLVIKVTIFDFMLPPSLGAPKLGSVEEGLVDQPTGGGGIVSLVFIYVYGRVL
jgi:hypothetical protein